MYDPFMSPVTVSYDFFMGRDEESTFSLFSSLDFTFISAEKGL